MLRVRWSHQGREEVLALARDEVKIGRGAENEIVLPDFSVSRRHAALRRESEGWALHDLASILAGRANGDFQAGRTRGIEQVPHPRQQILWRDLGEELLVVAVLTFHHVQHLRFRVGPPSQEQFQRTAARNTAQRLIPLTIKRDPQFIGEALPALIVQFSRISQHAVKIENTSAYRHP